jgi:segregation and condensation protein B
MLPGELRGAIEAVLFVAGEPVHTDELLRAFEISGPELTRTLDELDDEYNYQMRGLRLKRFGSHVQMVTRADYAPYVERMLQPVQKQSLSQSAMETLAIVAYRQPVTKAQIEALRGVKCDYSVQSLVAKGLIGDVGRMDMPGRPILYATTDGFLSHFGMGSLEELPPMEAKKAEEPSEIHREAQGEWSD